jgi:hypothetical protein
VGFTEGHLVEKLVKLTVEIHSTIILAVLDLRTGNAAKIK